MLCPGWSFRSSGFLLEVSDDDFLCSLSPMSICGCIRVDVSHFQSAKIVSGRSYWVDGKGVQCRRHEGKRSKGAEEQFEYALTAMLSATDVTSDGPSTYTS